MEIKKKEQVDMTRFRGKTKNLWPGLNAAISRLADGEAIIIPADEWKGMYQNSKSPKNAAKARIKAAAKQYGKKVTILADPDNEDLAVIRTA
jgi:hypothetical protein